MSNVLKLLRGLLLSLPILAISGFAIFETMAVTAPVPTGKISPQAMADFTAFPAGSQAGSNKVPPVVMLAVSTDEQLFYKAFTDYTDMTGDGVPDITYNNTFQYQGYFNPNVCYTYASNTFTPAATTTTYKCSGKWSGNFLNWATMSRLDMLRYALYGGYRSTDTATKTVLTRALIPNDGHAWVKVYANSTTNGNVSDFTPNTGTSISLCNAYVGAATTSGATTAAGLHVVSGTYTQWASMESSQCQTTSSDANAPSTGVSAYSVSVAVCDGTYDLRTMCKAYGTTGSISNKPTGVLQQFGESDSAQQLQFAMLSGTRVTPRKGGILRKNAAFIEGNTTTSGTVDHTCTTASNEVSFVDGTFCAASTNPGIISNLSLISLATTSGSWSGSVWNDCGNYGIYNRYPGSSVNGVLDDPGAGGGSSTNYHCGAWGNPVAEMYGEALRYMSGAASATTGFDGSTDDGLGMTHNLTWKSPLTETNWCASCAIVLISSGQVTFDGDEIPSLTSVLSETPATATNELGGASGEGINGGSYIVGDTGGSLAVGATGTTTSDVCQAQTVSNFSLVRGICPDGASMEGSYLVSGEAWQAWVNGITVSSFASGNTHGPKPIKTYSVALSESMPTFSIPTSAGSITLSPLCQSSNGNPNTAPVETGVASSYRTCGLLALQLGQLQSAVSPNYTYGQTFNASGTSGSFTVIWDDSTWGNDHDLDVTSMVSWCVGTACGSTSNTAANSTNFCWNTNVSGAKAAISTVATATTSACTNGHLKTAIGANQVLVRTEILTASAGNDLTLGFAVAGATPTSSNGVHRTFYRPGNQNYNLITGTSTYPTNWTTPQVEVFTPSGSSALNLQNPLWYAAKYGGFTYAPKGLGQPAATNDVMPTAASQWQGTDGNPSNYFLARDPSALVSGLQNAFQQIANSAAANNFGNATTPSSSNDINGNGLSYQVQYYELRNGVSWTGSLVALWSDGNGYLREGSLDGTGNEVLSPGADYVVIGPDTSPGASPGALANYLCTVAPVPPAGATTFNPAAAGNAGVCSIVSTSNPLQPAWDGTTLLNAYYDPTTTAGQAANTNLATQRAYSADASASANIGQRYIFTYLNATPDTSAITYPAAVVNGTATTTVNGKQTPFVWDDAACNATTGVYTPTATHSGFCGAISTAATTLGQRTGDYGFLNEMSPALTKSLVNWVRGVEDPTDYRSRTSNLSSAPATYRLGDIVDSSPAIVGTPAESFDLLYNDFTYAAFRSTYNSRRQMIYVGGNDGMLHAFNGGFYQPAQAANGTIPATNPTALRQLTSSSGLTSGDPTVTLGNNWALGQEVWAFIPDNLLPHLRWMADKNYTHVFYVDGSPVVTDVQIWGAGSSTTCQAGTPAASDNDGLGHICGWGTVMVVPFHLGGGLITVDTVGNATTPALTNNTQTSNSAYVIMDVTDPEKPPTVLGEISTGTFTLGAPAFAVHKEADGLKHFLLTIGSGPADNGGPTGTTNKPVAAPSGTTYMGVWVYDMANFAATAASGTPVASFTGATGGGPENSFTGDMVASDFNLNYSAEAVYFGVVTNPPTLTPPAAPGTQAYGGGLWKLSMTTATGSDSTSPAAWTLTQVINTGQPVTIRPSVAVDSSFRKMVYFGTGRAYTANDLSGTTVQGTQQQDIYGVSDNSLLTNLATACQAMPTTSSLFNSTNTAVTSTNVVSGTGLTGISTLSALEAALTATNASTGCYTYSGWQLALAAGDIGVTDGTNAQQPSERVISSQTLFGGILLTPTYIPPNAAQIIASGSSVCNPTPVPGTSFLYALDYLTGSANGALGFVVGTSAVKSVSMGSGIASSPVLHVSPGGKVTAAFGIGGGTEVQSLNGLPPVKDSEISWREPVDNQ